jgi:DNA polymerase (family 10)
MIHRRPENALDIDAVLDACAMAGVAVEVNGLPDRLDLRDAHVRTAVAAGVPVVVSTDAHSTRGLDYMALAVGTARRGGAHAAGILNTHALEDVLGYRGRAAG